MKKRNPTLYLKSSFVVTGRFKAPITEFVKNLQEIPSLNLAKGGAIPVISLTETNGLSTAELRVLSNRLEFTYMFEKRSLKEYTRNLIRFLSILAYSVELFEVDLASIYPSIIEVLAEHVEGAPLRSREIWNAELMVRRIKDLADMNCSLSLEIKETCVRNEKLAADSAVLARFSKEVIENASEKVGKADKASEVLPKFLGVTIGAYESVLPLVFGKVK